MSDFDELKEGLLEPVHAFDHALEQQPDLIIPLAVIHLIPIALTLGGGIAIIRGHQKLRAEKKTDQAIEPEAGNAQTSSWPASMATSTRTSWRT